MCFLSLKIEILILQNASLNWRKRSVIVILSGRRGDLMVSALDSGSSVPSSSPGRGHCVFLSKTLYSRSASLHPVYKRVAANLMLEGNPAMD